GPEPDAFLLDRRRGEPAPRADDGGGLLQDLQDEPGEAGEHAPCGLYGLLGPDRQGDGSPRVDLTERRGGNEYRKPLGEPRGFAFPFGGFSSTRAHGPGAARPARAPRRRKASASGSRARAAPPALPASGRRDPGPRRCRAAAGSRKGAPPAGRRRVLPACTARPNGRPPTSLARGTPRGRSGRRPSPAPRLPGSTPRRPPSPCRWPPRPLAPPAGGFPGRRPSAAAQSPVQPAAS